MALSEAMKSPPSRNVCSARRDRHCLSYPACCCRQNHNLHLPPLLTQRPKIFDLQDISPIQPPCLGCHLSSSPTSFPPALQAQRHIPASGLLHWPFLLPRFASICLCGLFSDLQILTKKDFSVAFLVTLSEIQCLPNILCSYYLIPFLTVFLLIHIT